MHKKSNQIMYCYALWSMKYFCKLETLMSFSLDKQKHRLRDDNKYLFSNIS